MVAKSLAFKGHACSSTFHFLARARLTILMGLLWSDFASQWDPTELRIAKPIKIVAWMRTVIPVTIS